MRSICGMDCENCTANETCNGCAQTGGRPFGGVCVVAECCQTRGFQHCRACDGQPCELKQQLIAEFNALHIPDMKAVTDLHLLHGSYINLPYTLANGQTIQLLEDDAIYLGNQLCKKDSNRCYGLATDGKMLLVCEYGDNGSEAEIVLYKKR